MANPAVFQLREKVQGLNKFAEENKEPWKALNSLARAMRIPETTLKTNLKSGGMSEDNQRELAKLCGFSTDWPEWRDPNASRRTPPHQRRDTAEAFVARFKARKSEGTSLTIERGPAKYLDRRLAQFEFAQSASFEPLSQATGIPMVIFLWFSDRGKAVSHDLTVGLKEVELQLLNTPSPESVEAFPLACLSGDAANYHGTVHGLSPYWIINVVEGKEGCLAGLRRPNNGQDCIFRGLQAGDEIMAQMTARVSDCFVSLTGQRFDKESDAKKQFIEHLVKLKALQSEGGEAVLGVQTLNVIKEQ